MAVACGPDDIVRLVKEGPEHHGTQTVLVDFNSSPLFYDEWEAPPVENNGPIYLASVDVGRVLNFKLNVEKQASTDALNDALQEAQQLLSRGEVWLEFRKSTASESVFFRIRPSDVTAITEYWTIASRTIQLALKADPFAYGLEVSGSETVTNSPASGIGVNAMQFQFPDIQGDVVTPVAFNFPTEDAAHKVQWASEATWTDESPLLLLDDYNRPDSTSSVGNPLIGPTPTVYAGTAGIINHKAYFPVDSAGYVHLAYDVGTPDVVIETKIDVINGVNSTAIIFARSGSLGNGIYLGSTQLFRIVASASTAIDTLDQQIFPGDTVRMVCDGDDIRVYVQRDSEGEFVLISSVTETTFNTVESHGYGVFGTLGDTARWASFRVSALQDDCHEFPYYKSLSLAPLDSTPPTGWSVTDTPDANFVSGTRRRVAHSSYASIQPLFVPTDAVLQSWPDLPPGDYRVMVRMANIDLDTELLFWNRPPISGSVLVYEEAATKTQAGVSASATTDFDWFDLGVVALPGGAPLSDPMFGLDENPATPLWNFGLYIDRPGVTLNTDLDVIMLVPAGRPRTLTRHGYIKFDAQFTGKTAYVDGVNGRRYARGVSPLVPGVTTDVAVRELGGAAPVVVPRACNIMTFFRDVYVGEVPRVVDNKADTTLIEWSYFPRYLNDRPPGS